MSCCDVAVVLCCVVIAILLRRTGVREIRTLKSMLPAGALRLGQLVMTPTAMRSGAEDLLEAKDGLENCCKNIRNTLKKIEADEKFVVEADDKEILEAAVQDTLNWLNENRIARPCDFKAKQRLIEDLVDPILVRMGISVLTSIPRTPE